MTQGTRVLVGWDFVGLSGTARHGNGGNRGVSMGSPKIWRFARVSRAMGHLLVDRGLLAVAGPALRFFIGHPISGGNLPIMAV